MNERIQKLAKQAGLEGENGHYEYDFFDPQKFAELIIRECAANVANFYQNGRTAADVIKEHFGVE